MPADPAKAAAVQVTLNNYTQHCNDLTNNPQASAKDIREKRTQFLDQVGVDVGRPFNPRGNSKMSTWEYDLLKPDKKGGLAHHAPGQRDAVRALNERFKTLAVAETVKDYTNWLNTNPQASAGDIEARRIEFLNQAGDHIGLRFDREGRTTRRAWEYDLLRPDNKGLAHHAPGQRDAVKDLNEKYKKQARGRIQAAVPPPPQGREDFADMMRRRTAQARKADPSQHQEPPGASSSQEIHAPMPVRQGQLPTINSADEQNSETSEQITYLSQAKNGLKQLVDAIVNRDDANRDRLWRQFTVKSGLQFSVAHVKTVIENALKRVRDFPATTTGQYQALQEIQIGLTASNNKLQDVINNLENIINSQSSGQPHTSHPSGRPAQQQLVQCIVDIQSGFLLILQGANKTVEAGST